MTEKEKLECAIHCMKVNADIEVCEECNAYNMGDCECRDIAREAIKALEEVQEYRTLGKLEDLKDFLVVVSEDSTNAGEDGISLEFIKNLVELKRYKELGTLEEVRNAVEKQKPKKLEFMHMTGETRAKFRCQCGNVVFNECYGVPDDTMQYCDRCGQKWDWSDERE